MRLLHHLLPTGKPACYFQHLRWHENLVCSALKQSLGYCRLSRPRTTVIIRECELNVMSSGTNQSLDSDHQGRLQVTASISSDRLQLSRASQALRALPITFRLRAQPGTCCKVYYSHTRLLSYMSPST